MRLSLAVLASVAMMLAGCRQIATIPPTGSPVSQEELVVTGVGIIDAQADFPIREDQIYPQVRARALEQAVRDAQGRMILRIAEEPVGRGGVTMGDMMDRHESVRLLAGDFVRELPNDPPRWMYDEAKVEVDVRVQRGDLQQFISSLPLSYLLQTEATHVAVPSDYSPMLPPPAPEQQMPPAPMPE